MFQCNKSTQLLGLLCPWTIFYYILHSFPVKTSGTQCKMQLYSIFNWAVPILPSLIFVRNANSTTINVFDRLINLGFEMEEEIVFILQVRALWSLTSVKAEPLPEALDSAVFGEGETVTDAFLQPQLEPANSPEVDGIVVESWLPRLNWLLLFGFVFCDKYKYKY